MLRCIAAGLAAALAVAMAMGAAAPAQAVYPPTNTPSAPLNVVAVAGDATVVVAWQPPATDGGSALTGYVVSSSPASAGCAVGAAVGSCEITGLTNGTSYTFFVQAKNAAGTGPAGASNVVTPQAAAPTITISATRAGGTIFVSGTTKNVKEGSVLSAWVRIQGETSFTQDGPATVGATGSFSWSGSVPADKDAEIYFSFEGVNSNVLSVPADAQTSLAIGGTRSGSTVSISGLSTNVRVGSSVSLLTRVNGRGDFALAGTAIVDADGRFAWTGTQPEDDQLDVVAQYNGLRSNILAFAGANNVTLAISGTRTPNGRTVTVRGVTTGIPDGALVQPTVTLDGSPVSGAAVPVDAGAFLWQRSVGADRTVRVSFAYSGTASNLLTLVPGEPTIGISGARSGGSITATGITAGLDAGTSVLAYVRVEGEVGFTATTRATVQEDGSFAWSRQLAATRGAEVYFTGGGATSNTVYIPAEASSLVITGTRVGTTISVSGLATGLETGDEVILRVRPFGESRYRAVGTTPVSAQGTFAFTTTAPLDTGVSLLVRSDSAQSNVLAFNPLAPAIVVLGGSLVGSDPPQVSAYGQAFNLPAGTVLVPFLSLNGAPYIAGSAGRTLEERGDFAWSRRVSSSVTTVSVYFATADGVTSNTITLKR